MSGVALSVGFDDTPIRRHLALLALTDARGFDGVRREVGEYLVGDVLDAIQDQRLFDDSAMPQSKRARGQAPGSRSRKRNKRTGRYAVGKTLLDTGRLRDSYTYQLVPGGLEVGSALEYAAIHHFGGETGRAGHRFTLPARPVLGIAARQEAALGDFLIAEIERTQR